MAKNRRKASSALHGQDQAVSVQKAVRMNFVMSSDINPIFANQMLVQADETSTYLSFFVVQPPVILGSEEEVQKRIDELEEVNAKMVAQVIVPRERMAKFVEVMTTTIGREPALRALIEGQRGTSAISHQ